MAKQLSVGIIGGGYAGMAAAVALAECGITVTVFESAKQLGGRARGVPHNNPISYAGNAPVPSPQPSPDGRGSERPLTGDALILDNGQHLLLGCYQQTLHMIGKVGGNIEQDFLRQPLQLELHREFSLYAPALPAPLHLLVALFSARGLSFRERIDAVRFMLALRNIDFELELDCIVAELLDQYRQGKNLVEKLWEPLCVAALNTPIHKASAQVLLHVLRDALNQSRAASDMLLPRIDFTSLFPQRAASFITQRGGKVLTGCSVDALHPLQDGIELATGQGSTQFSHVICAASPAASARLLRPIADLAETVDQIERLEYQPIYTVYLQYSPAVRLPQPMLGLHRRNSQWLFDRGRINGQAGLIAAVISAEGMHQNLSHEELIHKVTDELRSEFGFAEMPSWSKVIAEKRATFCCLPDLQRPSQLTALPRLLLAGDFTRGDYPSTLEGAVISGLKCADIISA